AALFRLILRRDWLVLLVCVILPALLAVATVAAFNQLLPSTASLEAFVFDTANIPAEMALLGRIYAPTIAGLTAWRWSAYSAVLVELGSALFVVRHSRTQEEEGRFELLDATVVGRQAALIGESACDVRRQRGNRRARCGRINSLRASRRRLGRARPVGGGRWSNVCCGSGGRRAAH
ncbi:MAG: hypothetical protein ACXW06_07705, partial [Halobacteriota archaeon]